MSNAFWVEIGRQLSGRLKPACEDVRGWNYFRLEFYWFAIDFFEFRILYFILGLYVFDLPEEGLS